MRKVSPSGEVSASYPLQPVGLPVQPRVLFLSPCPLFSLAGLTLALSNQQQSFQKALDIGAHDRRGEAASQVSSDQAHLLASHRGAFPQAKTCDQRLDIPFHRFQLEQEVWSQCLNVSKPFTKIECYRAQSSHEHDLGALDPAWSNSKKQPIFREWFFQVRLRLPEARGAPWLQQIL